MTSGRLLKVCAVRRTSVLAAAALVLFGAIGLLMDSTVTSAQSDVDDNYCTTGYGPCDYAGFNRADAHLTTVSTIQDLCSGMVLLAEAILIGAWVVRRLSGAPREVPG